MKKNAKFLSNMSAKDNIKCNCIVLRSILLLLFAVVITLLPINSRNITATSAVKKVIIKNGNLNVTKKNLIMYVRTKTQLTTQVKPSSAMRSLSYSSNNTAVATVDKKGKIVAQKIGTAKIIVTVKGKNGKKKTAYVKVKVKNKEVSEVILNKTNETIEVGDTIMLLANVSPNDATEQVVTWTSSKTTVATVSSEGIVKGISEGDTIITAKAGGKKAKCKIKVIDPALTDIFAGGRGTAESPYQIESKEQFLKISEYPEKYFIQKNDIDLNYDSFSSLFGEDNAFNGVYDGNGYSISNYNYNDTEATDVSVFGVIGKEGRIKNFIIKDSFLTAASGALLVLNNQGQIQNCKVMNSSITINTSSYNHSERRVGALCAINNGIIQESFAEVTLVGVANGHVTLSGGGIAGENVGSIISCATKCSIKITVKDVVNRDESYSGGITGINTGVVSNCQSEGAIYAYAYYKRNTYAGGISALNDGQVLNSTFLGKKSDIVGEGDYGNVDCNVGIIVGGGSGSVN